MAANRDDNIKNLAVDAARSNVENGVKQFSNHLIQLQEELINELFSYSSVMVIDLEVLGSTEINLADLPTPESALIKEQSTTNDDEPPSYLDETPPPDKSADRLLVKPTGLYALVPETSAITRCSTDQKIPVTIIATRLPRKTRWTAAELLAENFPDPTGPIPGLIPIGLTILGSRPKVGKSRLLLQASCAWGVGGKFLDMTLVNKRILYYSLDDPEQRLQDRLNKLGLSPSATVIFEREITPLYLKGAISQIEREAENCDIIIIDTLRRAMPGKDFNKDGALFDYVLGQLQTIAQNKQISIIVVLHTRKAFGQDLDPVDDVLGSTGLTASADCVLAIYKQANKTSALFKGRHKDFGDIDLTIEFDPITYAWQLVRDTAEDIVNEDDEEILRVVSEHGKVKPSTVAQELGKNRGNTSEKMSRLWVKGKLRKEMIEGITHYYIHKEDIDQKDTDE